MSVIGFFIAFAAIVILIILRIITTKDGQASATASELAKKGSLLLKVLLVLGLIVGAGFGSLRIIPTGYTGIRSTFGQIDETPVPNGIAFTIPLVQDIELICNKQQDKFMGTQVWGETKAGEKTPVYASEITVTYQVSQDKSPWIVANVKNTDELISDSVVSSAIKSAMTQFGVDEVTVRSYIEPAAREALQNSVNERYGEGIVSIVKLTINDMDFEVEYNNAIAQKSIAAQTQQKQVIENQTAIAKAEAEKQVAITNAQAKAEADKIAAEAAAQILTIKAEAEAAANQKIAASLSDALIQKLFYDKWDGVMPNVMGEGTVITDIAPTEKSAP